MKLQNQIVLSLGSNMGNKLNNIQTCVDLIHNKIATVIKVSKVYQTPAWGFESSDFYNCVLLVHTSKSVQKILKEVLQLEKKLGRIRTNDISYQARSIDIDIILCNEECVLTDDLTIPHKLMHKRKFVLVPMLDLQLEWQHPNFKKSIYELLENCEDSSDCNFVSHLSHPNHLLLQNLNYIAIEGNIGSGKTTFATKLAEDYNAKLVLERFADNPFLPKFYQDKNRFAFPLEMSFLADRYHQLSADLAQFDLFKDLVVTDYYMFKSLLFAKITLQEDEYRLYKAIFNFFQKEIPKPNLYIYLYQNTENLLKNIKKRGRPFEQNIEANYLEKINKGYLDFIKTQTHLNILVIDCSQLDFVKKQEDYIFLLNEICSKAFTIYH
ncbi:MAG TPA: 2-amino-4-hydroxy-6-hydroxymethyldihydropteridine diphosphokinase [Flavobacterium sp.]|nr:2-amino-4-hydroxy-6-hydroxymethyldihydropteridine diphosphokinase [Flavobacterium sp.]